MSLQFVPLIPIVSAVFLAFFGRRIPKLAGWIATGAVFAALGIAVPIATGVLRGGPDVTYGGWMFSGTESLTVMLGLRVDPLSAVMLLVVLGVGSLIHLFSIEYMAHDKGVARYFAYLNMFISFMLLLILGDNLFLLFVGWEGVGLASYCLIGFWYENDAPPKAGMKAFITNRIGDVGFMLGLLILATLTHSAAIPTIESFHAWKSVNLFGHQVALVELVALLLFIGACGKSAQFPLHVWLPDAMEGPTPVSALIHAATMVTAGVYMIARLDAVFAMAETVRSIMLVIALITSLGAAFAALAQTDLKRILAYSTISQLGYMMCGVAVGAKDAAVFHLATHAVFKALLFLSAGSVMHALSGELDIVKMGGLIKRIPKTSIMLIIGSLGLAGVPFFAGFYSKDMIITAVSQKSPIAAGVMLLGALVTAFYSTRMVRVALFGKERLDHHTSEHLHESGPVILVPLAVLSLGTLVVGHLYHNEHYHSVAIMGASIVAALIGIAGGWIYYGTRLPQSTPLTEFLKSGFRLDDLYAVIFIRPFAGLAKWSRDIVDKVFLDSIAHGSANLAAGTGVSMRSLQTGNIGTYLCYMAFGVAAMIWYIIK